MNGENLDLTKYDLPLFAYKLLNYCMAVFLFSILAAIIVIFLLPNINFHVRNILAILITSSALLGMSISLWGKLKAKKFYKRQEDIKNRLKPN